MISSHLSAEIFRLPYKLYVAGVMVSIPTLGKYEAHFNRRFCCMNGWQTRRGLAFSETAESRDKPVTIIQSMLRRRLLYTFVLDPQLNVKKGPHPRASHGTTPWSVLER